MKWKKLGQVFRPNTDVIDCQVIKEDRGKIFFVVTLDTFVNLIKGE